MIVALWVVLGFYGLILILHGKRHHETEADVERVEDWQGRHAGRMFEQGNDLSKLTDRVDAAVEMLTSNAASTKAFMELVNSNRKYDVKDADRDRKAAEERITALACQLRIAAAKLESHEYDA